MVLEWLSGYLNVKQTIMLDLLSSIAVVLVLIVLRALLLRFVNRRTREPIVLYRWNKVTSYGVVFLALLLIIPLWLPNLSSLATVIGLLSAGIAIALRDPLTDLGGWLFIVSRRPFHVGDRIEIAGQTGDVIDIRMFQFSMLEVRGWIESDQSTGRIIHVPNKMVFSDTLANYTEEFPYIWHEIPVYITLDSNWKRAKTLLAQILENRAGAIVEEARAHIDTISERYLILYTTLTPTLYTRVHPHAIRLTMRYLVPVRQRRMLEHLVWEDILEAFFQHDDIAFAPTQRISSLEEPPPPPSGLPGNGVNQKG